MPDVGDRSRDEAVALRTIRVAGTIALVLGLALLVVLPAEPAVENVPGFTTAVLGFELASTPAHVAGILGGAGTPERARTVRRMMLGTWIDFLFALAYPTFYVGIAMFLEVRAGMRRGLLLVVTALAVTMAVADGLENGELLRLCGPLDVASMAESLARLRSFTLTKWYAIFVTSGLLVPFLWHAGGRWRWAALAFGGAAAFGALSGLTLPAIEGGSMMLLVAWVVTYGCSFGRPDRDRPG